MYWLYLQGRRASKQQTELILYDSEYGIGKDNERSGRGIIQGTIPAFTWKDW
jgi:hypothetical protein